MGDRFHGMAHRAKGSGLNRGVRCGAPIPRSPRATRATTELTVAGGPRVRIHLPPALSHVRTRLPRSVGRLASTCGYHCPLGGSGLPGCGCPYAGHLGCFPSGSIGAARSLQVMIFVIRFLLFVARPRRSGPFLRSPGSSSSGKGLSEAARSPKRLENRGETGEGIAAARCGRRFWYSEQVMVRAGRIERSNRNQWPTLGIRGRFAGPTRGRHRRSRYGHGEDKRRPRAPGNHFILSSSQ